MRYRITAPYGEVEGVHKTPHTGIDFAMNLGTPLRSIHGGIVSKVYHLGNRNVGNAVLIKWDNGRTAIYGHMSKVKVQEGQNIDPGQLIGYSGNSGFSTGPHLHFGLKYNGHFIDPSKFINKIEHMDDKEYLVNAAHHQIHHISSHTHLSSMSEIMQNQMKMLHDITSHQSLNTINLLSDHLINNSVFAQAFQNLFKFFS